MKPLTIKELKEQSALLPCPLCERPNLNPTDHHMIPRSRGGKTTETICRDCHKAIHATFTNKQLEREYNNVDTLMTHEVFAKMIRFISKQDPGGKLKIDRNRKRPKRP